MALRTSDLEQSEWTAFIGGSFVDTGGEPLPVENPATGETIAEVLPGTADDIDAAIAAARKAFDDGWRELKPLDRTNALYAVADAVEEHHDELVELETLENGKPLPQSDNDVTNTESLFRYYAGAVGTHFGDAILDSRDEVLKAVHEPYGVVGIITPYNWPTVHVADFVAPALAAGNGVVLKPSPETPLCALRIAELAQEALPDGVFNVVPGGVEAGAALTEHPDVDMLAFTGSDATGQTVLEAAAKHITPAMMELGGKNPAIVFADADVEKAISGLVYNTFYNSGQACTNPERWLVHEDVHDEVVEGAAAAIEDLIVGDGRDPATDIGPQITDAQYQKFVTAIDRAVEEGAEIVAQADAPTDEALAGGHWAPPTLLRGVTPDMAIAQEEVFGPVGGVITFETEEEAIEIANGVEYGLAAAIWTTDVNRAHRLSRELDAGIITINHPLRGRQGLPFGGFKRSGIGKKRAFAETLMEYSRTKSIQMDLTDKRFPLSYGNR